MINAVLAVIGALALRGGIAWRKKRGGLGAFFNPIFRPQAAKK
jgi:hypothetical protein